MSELPELDNLATRGARFHTPGQFQLSFGVRAVS